ncbi:MAG: response regulator [Desulfobacterales bacterium]
MNLALNASHAMSGEGKISIETRNIVLDKDVRTTNRGADRGEYVLLKITDTGHGIEKEVQHRMFEPFFTTKEPGKGTGLGLSMVYSIVKNHHGHIECDSAPGAGTRFNIYFPASTSANALKDEISTKKEKLATGNETILVIEDDESVLDALKRMLEHFGYAIITASNGEKAIEIYLAEQDRIDLVIISLNMPGMGGRRCLERMLEIKPDLKTIVTSGYSSAASVEDIHKSGTSVFIEKPYQLENLLRAIREVVDG